MPEPDDLCGFCGQPGADTKLHGTPYPGQKDPGTPYVHETCLGWERCRAHAVYQSSPAGKAVAEWLKSTDLTEAE